MSQAPPPSGSDADGIGDFLIAVAFVYPVTNWLLRPGRFSRTLGLSLAIGFLVAVASTKTALEFRDKGPNYYRILGVGRDATAVEVKKKYKARALELHPDKNPSAQAATEFDRVKKAFDVLSDADSKEAWERFGPEKVQRQAVVEDSQVFFEMLIFHAAWAILAFVLTLGKAGAEARTGVYVGQLLLFLIEVYLTLQEGTVLPVWMPSQIAKHEVCSLLRSLFPSFVNGCRCVGSVLHIDTDERNRRLFLRLDEQNKDVLMVLRSIQVSISNLQQNKGGGSTAMPSAAVTATGKLRELEERLGSGGNAAVAEIGEELKKEQKSNPMMGVVGFLAIYFALQWAFSGQSSG